jgi:hypothetical protein
MGTKVSEKPAAFIFIVEEFSSTLKLEAEGYFEPFIPI